MSNVIKPVGYKALLDMRQTEMGIKLIKEFFQANLSTELRLRRVTAPAIFRKNPTGRRRLHSTHLCGRIFSESRFSIWSDC